MIKRSHIMIALWPLLLFTGIAVSVVFLWRLHSKATPSAHLNVTEENFLRLKVGMTEEQVETILGEPGEYECRFTDNYYKRWQGLGCIVIIRFHDEVMSGWLKANDGRKLKFP